MPCPWWLGSRWRFTEVLGVTTFAKSKGDLSGLYLSSLLFSPDAFFIHSSALALYWRYLVRAFYRLSIHQRILTPTFGKGKGALSVPVCYPCIHRRICSHFWQRYRCLVRVLLSSLYSPTYLSPIGIGIRCLVRVLVAILVFTDVFLPIGIGIRCLVRSFCYPWIHRRIWSHIGHRYRCLVRS